MKVGATTSALLSSGALWSRRGGYEKLRPQGVLACFTKLGMSWDERARGWRAREIFDDARFSRGKKKRNLRRDPDPSDLCTDGPMEVE